jgi:MFS family permease
MPCVAGLASLIVAFAPGLPTVMAGRLMYGVGIGFAMHAAPAYIAGAPLVSLCPPLEAATCCRRCCC